MFDKWSTLLHWLPPDIQNNELCTDDIAQWILKHSSLDEDFVMTEIDDLVHWDEQLDRGCDVTLLYVYKFENGTILKKV